MQLLRRVSFGASGGVSRGGDSRGGDARGGDTDGRRCSTSIDTLGGVPGRARCLKGIGSGSGERTPGSPSFDDMIVESGLPAGVPGLRCNEAKSTAITFRAAGHFGLLWSPNKLARFRPSFRYYSWHFVH
jgi:hypothetical protein